jgi:hypothetical protein
MSSRHFSTLSVILLLHDPPECLSSSTDTHPVLKHEYYLNPAVQLKTYSPKASQSISMVSVVYLPSFMQNLKQTHSLNLLFQTKM